MSAFVPAIFRILAHAPRARGGQSLVEYALVLSFVSVLCVALLSVMGPQIRGIFSAIVSALAAVQAAI